MHFVSIPSKVIEKSYLPVFIGFNKWMEDAVFQNDSTLLPEEDKRGYGFNLDRFSAPTGAVSISINSSKTIEYQKRYLKSLETIFELHIDSKHYSSIYSMTTNQKDRFGFETYLDIGNLSKGKHLLRFIGPSKNSEGIFVKDTLINIPFWYYPQNTPTIANSNIIEVGSTVGE